MSKIVLSVLISVFFLNNSFSQKVIEMTKINGVYQIPCKVNGIPMNFIFDTGASDVSISITEAKFLLKNGLLQNEDFIENVNYKIANGDIIEGTKINLKTVEIDGIVLSDISATVIHQQNAPLLLGQSAISKLGPFTIDSDKLIIEDTNSISDYETEIRTTNEWMNEFFSVYTLKNESIDIKYEIIELKKMKLSGFAIFLKVTEHVNGKPKYSDFIIELNKITSVNFEENDDCTTDEKLVIESDKRGKGFLFYAVDEQFYETSNCFIKLRCLDDSSKERLIKAFINLIENNALYIKETQKF